MRLAVNQTVSIELNAKCKRNEFPSIELNIGEKYLITLVKIIEPWKDWFKSSLLHGFNSWYMYLIVKPRIPTANYFAVCGGIGDDDSHLFVIFENESEVKNGKQIEITKNGNIFFFANDANNFYKNNHGKIILNFKRIL